MADRIADAEASLEDGIRKWKTAKPVTRRRLKAAMKKVPSSPCENWPRPTEEGE